MEFLYKHKIVRDLAWVLQSESLIPEDPDSYRLFQEFLDNDFSIQLSEIDQNPSELIQYVEHFSGAKNRLGKYFEALVGFGLFMDERFDSIKSNLQIKEEGNTVGEMDFLFREKAANSWVHLEVAVKFYLMHHNQIETQFIGPNAKDQLKYKRKKLIEHQLSLTQQEAAIMELATLGVNKPDVRLMMLGYVFIPLNRSYLGDLDQIAQFAKKGWWVHFKESNTYLSDDASYCLVPKEEWLSPVVRDEHLIFVKKELLQRVKDNVPTMLAEVELRETGIWTEVTRGFVVPDLWPEVV